MEEKIEVTDGSFGGIYSGHDEVYNVTHCLNELKTRNHAYRIVLQCGMYSEDLKYLAESGKNLDFI